MTATNLIGADLTVHEGTDGWLFLDKAGPNMLRDMMADASEWHRTHLPRHIANYAARHQRVTDRGLPFVVVFPPEKSGIYREYLPQGWTVAIPTPAEVLAKALQGRGVAAICPSELFRAAKGPLDLYERTDSHWSSWGAYLCYCEIMKELGPQYLDRVIAWTSVSLQFRLGYGDLAVHVPSEPKRHLQSVEIPSIPVKQVERSFDMRDQVVRRVTCEQGIGRALIVRDSFTTALAPFFERTFAETVLLAPSPALLDSAIDTFQPDLVILEVAERGLLHHEEAFADWSARTFDQEHRENALNPKAGRLQTEAVRSIIAGKCDEAISLTAVAMALEGNPYRVYNLAWALRSQNKPGLCRQLLGALPMEHRNRFTHYFDAMCAFDLGQIPDARAAMDRALAEQPNNAMYLTMSGEFAFMVGDYEQAVAALQKAARYAPLAERAWLRLADAYRALDQPDQAAQVVATARDIFGPSFSSGAES